MQYSFWLIKETIIVVFVTCIHLQYIEGGRNDCETPDGRQGLWVVKKYCREAKLRPEDAYDNDSIFCCPMPTTHRSAQPPLFLVSEPGDTRNNAPKSIPNVSRNRTSVTSDIPRSNQSPAYGHANPGKDSSSSIPTNSHKVPSNANSDNGRTATSHYNPEERHKRRNNDLPKSVLNVPQGPDHQSGTSDFPRRPVYDHDNPGEDSLPNIPNDPHKELSSSSSGNRPTVTSYHNTNEHRDTRNSDFPKSVPNPTQDHNDPSIYNENQGRGYGHPSPRPKPGHPVNTSDRGTPGGRVRFDNPVNLFNDQRNKNRRLKPPSSDSDARPTVYHSEKDSSNTRNSAGPDSARNNPKRLPVGPSRDQFDVERLPSNPRRLKPHHNDAKNDTFDENIRHNFYPNSQPKVPACGVKPYDLFIAGGETSEAYEWPWMTSIFRRHQGSRPKTFLCGGSLINTKYVLTAAHCFVNNRVVLPASSFVVRLGSHYLDSGEEFAVADILIHHEHNESNFFNDIALVKISSQVYITDKIAPICLPTADMMSYDFVDRMATVAGWGDVAFRTGSSRALQHVTIPVVSSDECFAAYSRVRGAAFLAKGSDHIICAGLREGGKDACLGDSGGPLMLKTVDDRWIIVGIVSLGYKCAEPGYPGVYTRVTHYLSWINANVKPH